MAIEEVAGIRPKAPGLKRVALGIAGLRHAGRLVVAAAAGACGSLALPPLWAWPALILAVTVVLWLFEGIEVDEPRLRRRAGQAFLAGWAFGFGYFLFSLYWVGFAFLVEAKVFGPLLPVAVIALPAGMALYWGLAGAVTMYLSCGSRFRRALGFAVALAGAEWLRGHLFTGFPWNAPGYAAGAFDGLGQLAAFIGIYGVTLTVLLWAAAAAYLIQLLIASTPRKGALAAALFLSTAPLAWGLGQWRLQDPHPDAAAGVMLRIVQANVPQSDKWQAERRDEIFLRYAALSTSGPSSNDERRITHIIWPESALPVLVDERPEVLTRLAGLLPEEGMLLLGALRREPRGSLAGQPFKVFNSILAIDDQARVIARYDKWRLVPFGEFLPLVQILEPLGVRKLVPLPGSFAAGDGPMTLVLPSTPAVAPLICYEAIFPDRLVDRQARPAWLLNLTNDGWFGRSAGPYQHLEQARFRAIEEGLPLVRAANTGISAIIDPYGRVLSQLPLNHAGVLDSPLPQPIGATLYARLGDVPFFSMLGILLISLVLYRLYTDGPKLRIRSA